MIAIVGIVVFVIRRINIKMFLTVFISTVKRLPRTFE